MKIHYITGILALFVVAVHILMRLIVPYSSSLEYAHVIANYHNFFYAILLESIDFNSWIQRSQGNSFGVKTEQNLGK